MRLDEFYNPQNDRSAKRDFDDTRKTKLTLETLNKLRKYRELKKQENIQQAEFASIMYAQNNNRLILLAAFNENPACGCSWSCQDIGIPDIEFGKLIPDYYNAEYINLAKPACSNSGIAMQVDYIIDQDIKPDLVIINATTVTRTELKLLNNKRFNPSKSWDNVDYNMLQGEKFRDEHAPGYGKGYDPTITQIVFLLYLVKT